MGARDWLSLTGGALGQSVSATVGTAMHGPPLTAECVACRQTALTLGYFVLADNQICCHYVLAKFNGATLENDLIAELAPLIDFHQQHFTDSEACWLGRYLWPYWRT